MIKPTLGKAILCVPFGIIWFYQPTVVAQISSRLTDVASRVMLPWSHFSSLGTQYDPFLANVPKGDAFDVASSDGDCESTELGEGRFCIESGSPGIGKTRENSAKKARRRHPAEVSSLRVSQAVILRLAQAGRRPSGRTVAATAYRPQGIQVLGASALGIGVHDGDVLTHVSGVPVTSLGQVIALVLSARAAQQAVIVGKLWRGKRSYEIYVEQPYLPRGGDKTDIE